MSESNPQIGATVAEASSTEMGTFDESGAYTPRQVISDDLGGTSFEDAIADTIIEFDEGDIVSGTVVKVDNDEVLLDIGYKSEGVIPARELSIRHDVDPHDVVKVSDKIEALVMQRRTRKVASSYPRSVLSTRGLGGRSRPSKSATAPCAAPPSR